MVYNLNGVVISMDDNIAPQFSESTAYAAGAYVLKLQANGQNVLYKFTAAHAAGAWTGTDVVAVTAASELADVKSQINEEYNSENMWVDGLIGESNGKDVSGYPYILKTKTWFSPDVFRSVTVEDGYKIKIWAYNRATGAYVGGWNGSTFATSGTVYVFGAFEFTNKAYFYRVMMRKDTTDTTPLPLSDYTKAKFVVAPIFEEIEQLQADKVSYDIGKNLVNPAASNLLVGKYVEYNTGTVRNNAGYTSVKVPVVGGSKISTSGTANAHITFYTAEPPIFTGLSANTVIPGYISGSAGASVLTDYTVPANASCMIISCPPSRIGTTLQVEYGSTQTEFEAYKKGIKYSAIIDPPLDVVKTTEYTIKTDGSGDYTNLRACIEAITDSSPTNRYIIKLYPGTHDIISMYDSESAMPTNGLFVPDYTKLVGIGDKHNVIISGERETASTTWSVLNVRDYAEIENITIKSKNARYTIHDDWQTAINAKSYRYYKDVIFVGENCQYGSVYGSGLKGNSEWNFVNCEFDATKAAANGTAGNAFSLHNNINVTTSSFVQFKNCRLLNGSASYKTFRLLSMTTGSANGTVYVTLEGNKVDGIDLRENDASQYGAGCSFYVNGFGNVNTLGVAVASTDGVDYTSRVDLI